MSVDENEANQTYKDLKNEFEGDDKKTIRKLAKIIGISGGVLALVPSAWGIFIVKKTNEVSQAIGEINQDASSWIACGILMAGGFLTMAALRHGHMKAEKIKRLSVEAATGYKFTNKGFGKGYFDKDTITLEQLSDEKQKELKNQFMNEYISYTTKKFVTDDEAKIAMECGDDVLAKQKNLYTNIKKHFLLLRKVKLSDIKRHDDDFIDVHRNLGLDSTDIDNFNNNGTSFSDSVERKIVYTTDTDIDTLYEIKIKNEDALNGVRNKILKEIKSKKGIFGTNQITETVEPSLTGSGVLNEPDSGETEYSIKQILSK